MNITVGLDKEIDDADLDTYKIKSSSSCYFCETSMCSSNTYIHLKKLKVKTCSLCHTVSNFNKYYINHVMLCHSDLSQLNIIKLTHDYYKKHHKIPSPSEIDKSAKYVKIDCLTYAQFYDQLNFPTKNQFEQFVFFFTSEIKLSVPKNLFKQSTKNDKPYDISFFDLPIYKLSDAEILLFDQFTSQSKKQCVKEMNLVKSLLTQYIDNTKAGIKEKDLFLKAITDPKYDINKLVKI